MPKAPSRTPTARRMSNGELQLLRIRRRREPDAAPVAHAVDTHELANLRARRLGVFLLQVRALRVQLFVARQELRPVALERSEEMLLRPFAQIEQVRPHAGRACFAC